MTEPDVTLTDYALSVECVLFVALLCRGDGRASWRFWFVLLFGSVGVATLLGGTVHGFFLDKQSLGSRVLWPMTLLATGVTTLAQWAIGARLLFSRRVVRWIISVAIVEFIVYGLVVLFWSRTFLVAVVNNVPAVIFLIVACLLGDRRMQHHRLRVAAAGLALTLVAGLLQQSGVGIHPTYFNHNSLYHLFQAIALWLLFLGGRWLVRDGSMDR